MYKTKSWRLLVNPQELMHMKEFSLDMVSSHNDDEFTVEIRGRFSHVFQIEHYNPRKSNQNLQTPSIEAPMHSVTWT